MEPLGCNHCRNGISITEAERKYLSPKLKKVGLPDNPTIACMAKWRSRDLIIQGYLEEYVTYCDHFVSGAFHEVIPAKCHNCWTDGEIKVSRPVLGSLHFSCVTHTACKSSFEKFVLETDCRFCNSPLFLYRDWYGLMHVFCSKCKRSVPVPLLFRSWPALRNSEQCPHGHPLNNCVLCKESITKHISLIDLELPKVSDVWQGFLKGKIEELTAKMSPPEPEPLESSLYAPEQPEGENEVHDEVSEEEAEEDWWVSIHGTQALQDAQREIEEEINEERSGYIDDSERSEDNGWYYSDYNSVWD